MPMKSSAVIDFLSRRRSVKPDKLVSPAPSDAELQQILQIAARVPDHKKLVPWRFVVFQGDARAQFGEIIAAVCAEDAQQTPSAQRLETEKNRLTRAPLVVAVIAVLKDARVVPEWEQTLSAGAAAFNLCLAANALGYGTSWLTEWIAFDDKIAAALGLGHNERVVGFVHIGTPEDAPQERARPELSDVVRYWTPGDARTSPENGVCD